MNNLADPAAHISLWRRARAMLARVCDGLGEPAAIAQLDSLANARRRGIAGAVALLECIVRKLLFALAAAFVQDEGKPALAKTRTAGLQARLAPGATQNAHKPPIDLTQPASWRTRFALAPPRATIVETRPPASAQPPRPPRHVAPAPLRLAFRLEAVRRALAAPEPLARKLARIIVRLNRRDPRAGERYVITTARPYYPERGDAHLIVDAMAIAMFGAPLLAPDTS